MLAHLCTEAYPIYTQYMYPPVGGTYAACNKLSYELSNRCIDTVKHQSESVDAGQPT